MNQESSPWQQRPERKLTLVSLLGLILAAIASGLIYRAWRQWQTETSLVVAASNGIDESMFLTIAGAPEWITIRGQNRKQPGHPDCSHDALIARSNEFTTLLVEQVRPLGITRGAL